MASEYHLKKLDEQLTQLVAITEVMRKSITELQLQANRPSDTAFAREDKVAVVRPDGSIYDFGVVINKSGIGHITVQLATTKHQLTFGHHGESYGDCELTLRHS